MESKWTVNKFLVRLWEYYEPFRKQMFTLLGMLLTKQLLQATHPLFLGVLLDTALKQNFERFTVVALGWLSVRFLAMALNRYRESYEVRKFDYVIPRDVARRTLISLFGFSLGQVVSENSNVKRSVIGRGEHSIRTLAYMVVYDIVPLFFQSLIPVVILLCIAPWLGLMMVGCIIVFVWYTIRYATKAMPGFRRLNKKDLEVSKVSGEFVGNADTVMVNARADKAVSVTDAKYGELAGVGLQTWLPFIWRFYGGQVIHTVSMFAMIIIAGYLTIKGHYSYGLFVAMVGWIRSGLEELSHVSHIQRQAVQLYVAITRFFDLVDTKPDVVKPQYPIVPDRYVGMIEFRDVHFTYPSREERPKSELDELVEDDEEDEEETPVDTGPREPVVKGVSFVLEPGKRYAFVGKSGACKSTLVQLLLRSFDPQQGAVYIDGFDLKMLDFEHWRQRIGVVPQDVVLFDETLRFNIGFGLNGNGVYSDDLLRQASEQAQLGEFFAKLEKGFDTHVGERGIKLSGGQKQRVGIARALVKKPDVLILDEATSNLDTENEELIRKSIHAASQGRTTIIIAHRLATIRDVDEILVFDEGKLVGQGPFQEIARTNQVFRGLLKNQVAGVIQ